jgi:hypothetical protein
LRGTVAKPMLSLTRRQTASRVTSKDPVIIDFRPLVNDTKVLQFPSRFMDIKYQQKQNKLRPISIPSTELSSLAAIATEITSTCPATADRQTSPHVAQQLANVMPAVSGSRRRCQRRHFSQRSDLASGIDMNSEINRTFSQSHQELFSNSHCNPNLHRGHFSNRRGNRAG